MTERPSQRTNPLADSVAVITGASSGIGEATAHVLAEDGADVAIAARRSDRLESVAEEIREQTGQAVAVIPTDVTNSQEVNELVEETIEQFGHLDIAVSNAGLGVNRPITELSDDDFSLMRDVNIDGMFYFARATIPHLCETAGNLVFTGSMAANHPRPEDAMYAATKWWTRGFAISLQGTYGPDGVAVSCINPTEVRTEFGTQTDQKFTDRFDKGDVTEPIEVADAIAFAVRQKQPNAITSLDLYRRDKIAHF
ncbi:MAG: short-chain dehydrogenase [Haloquadratum sp. J07HQX50]|jgi:Short-chain alcohol dehydrogenase of unknown specificity|nr:MAG: short-chain dehydrogenase [Haloquadratum sp. J07HQX50]